MDSLERYRAEHSSSLYALLNFTRELIDEGMDRAEAVSEADELMREIYLRADNFIEERRK